MTDKSAFTKEEWDTLLGGILLSGVAITAAEPSGLIGLLQEGMAGGKLLAQQIQAPSNDLLKALASDFTTSEGRTAARNAVSARMANVQRADVKARALEGLASAKSIVAAKSPQDADAYRNFIVAIADATANAASEGGFLGFGGVTVSDAEKATLGEIQKVFG